jgi:hypothetical protein
MQRCNLNITSKYEYIFIVILRIYSFLHLFAKCSEISFTFENTVVYRFTQHDE